MLVHDFLIRSTDRNPEKTALIFQKREYTYNQIRQSASSLAGFLLKHSIRTGDRVAIYLGNEPATAISIFGALLAGGCFIIINPTIKANKLVHILNNSQARFLIAPFSKKSLLDKVNSQLDSPPETIYTAADGNGENDFEQIIEHPVSAELPRVIDDDLAAIIYTSGSTGDPKGVTMSHRNMVSASTSITTYLENIENDIILNMLPFSFDYGLYQLIMTFHIGGTLVLERGFGYPYQIIEIIKKYEVTGLPCVPTIFAILLQLETLEQENLSSVRYISNTAAALSPTYIPRLQKAFPRSRIYSMYGLTECKRVSYLPPRDINAKPDSVGIPMPNTEVWVADDNGQEVPRGKVGELVVRGGSVMRCYWRDPEATAVRLKEGKYPWEKVLYTGDLFRMDDEGYLYFVARKDDIIKCRGERVHPKEIETVLYSMDEVLNARVIGVPHEIYGQAIKAEVVLKEGKAVSDKEILAYCRQNLEDLMVPQIIEIVESLPISASGKIKRT